MRYVRSLMFGTMLGLAASVTSMPAIEAAAQTPPNMLVIANRIDDITTLDPAESFEFAGSDVSRNVYGNNLFTICPSFTTTLATLCSYNFTLASTCRAGGCCLHLA